MSPIFRGWIINLTEKEYLSDLTRDIQAAKTVGVLGYGVFTYESLLDDLKPKTLKDIKEESKF